MRGRHEPCMWRSRMDSNPCHLPHGHGPYSLIVHHHINAYGTRRRLIQRLFHRFVNRWPVA